MSKIKRKDYYQQHIDDVLDLLYNKFYEPISSEQWFIDKPLNMKKEAFYEWLNTEIYNANI